MKNQIRKILKEFVQEKQSVNESSLSRFQHFLMKHDCATISAFRNFNQDCLDGENDGSPVTKNENMIKTIELKEELESNGYGVTATEGTWLQNNIWQKEKSFFVVNKNNDEDFFEKMRQISESFCQDAFYYFEKGGENIYEVGTNNSNTPGYGKIVKKGDMVFNRDRYYKTKLRNKTFSVDEENEE